MTDEEVGKYVRLLCLQHQSKDSIIDKESFWIMTGGDKRLSSKFVESEEGFFNTRLKEESDKRKAYSESRRSNRKKHMNNTCKTYVPHMENENENKDKNKKVFNFKKSLSELGVEEQILSDWLKVRAKKKATNTETAFKAIAKEIEKSNKTANYCIKYAVEKDWRGFEADWLNNGKSKDIGESDFN